MKIEIGESLIYSYLRHVRNCLVTQTNWKPSGNWHIPDEIKEKAIYEFNKINQHHSFSEIFKSDFSQTIKQAEIDVLGVDQNNRIYAFEVAFHENGLQYGGKLETRNRVFKKLLRCFITLKCYFPNQKYSLAFCSPKVNPATEKIILEYFEVLAHDFQTKNVEFHYYSNEQFNSEILQKVLTKTINEADSSELFARSIKLLNITDKFKIAESSHQQNLQETNSPIADPSTEPYQSPSEYVKIGNFSIPTFKEPTESVQDYIKRIMHILLDNQILEDQEIKNLQDKEYCKHVFKLQFPLIRNISEGHKDSTGHGRYWSKEIFAGKYYVCSQWWKDHHKTYLEKIRQWLLTIENK